MNITYRPYFRDVSPDELFIKNPAINIVGYKPKYNITESEEETETPEVSNKEEKVVSEVIQRREKSSDRFRTKKEFKDHLTPIYEQALIKKGLNPVFAKALVAQDGLESAWGSKPSGNFNFGGIKGTGTTKRTREVINGKTVYISDNFKDFKSIEDYVNYKINLLNNKRYRAFSGDVSEFADRVQKGGYATDPNYSMVLNRLINFAKNGGVLKFQYGGRSKGKEWVKTWYQNRRAQIKKNLQQNSKIPIPTTEKFAYHLLAKNMDLKDVVFDPNIVWEYFSKTKKRKEEQMAPSIREWVNKSNPTPQIKEIDKIKEIFGDALYDQKTINPDSNLDDSKEIYVRLMQLRHALGIDANHKFVPDEIEDLKQKYTKSNILKMRFKGNGQNVVSTTEFDKDGNIIKTDDYQHNFKISPEKTTNERKYDEKDTFQILNRYNTNAIVRLLNDVAKNETTKKDNLTYAKDGTKIQKYQHSGILKNAFYDPNHYYDYSKGSYDKESGHWFDRDPETGLELKNPNHPTAFMHHEIEQQIGNKRYKDNNGMYYTFPDGEAPIWQNAYGYLSPRPGLKEVDYPSYGKGNLPMEESIKDNLPKVKWIWNEFITSGATPEQAAAVLGNIWKESRIQYDSKSKRTGAHGLVQLLGQRLDAYKEFLSKNNLLDSTENQIKYLNPIIFGDEENPHNLDNYYNYFINKKIGYIKDKYNSFGIDWDKKDRKAFKNAKGIDNITVAFANSFERMGKDEADYKTRKEAANYIYNLMTQANK